MKKFSATLCFCVLLIGCQKPEGSWMALRDTEVYKNADERDELKFIIKKGSICSLGQERVIKVYMYKEVLCEQGAGWVIYSERYPFVKIDDAPAKSGQRKSQ